METTYSFIQLYVIALLYLSPLYIIILPFAGGVGVSRDGNSGAELLVGFLLILIITAIPFVIIALPVALLFWWLP